VALPDGSSFDLNTNSRVEVDYSQRTRVIRLERGEAYFKVAHDTHRPFWVHAGDRWVRAVGTAFNVYLRPTGVEVTVSEGTVNVVNAAADESPPSDASYTKSAASVTAGEQADAHGRADVIHALDKTQLSRLLAWRKSSLYFQDEPLGDVVDELMRYTTLKIEIADDSLRQLPVGGTFQTSPEGAEALLRMLQDGFGTKIRRIDADHGTGSAITHAVPSVAPDLVSFLVRKYLRRFQKMAVVFHDTHEILRDMLPREHHGLCLIANPRTGERWRQSWRSRTSCRE